MVRWMQKTIIALLNIYSSAFSFMAAVTICSDLGAQDHTCSLEEKLWQT